MLKLHAFSGEDTDNTHSDDIGGYTPPKAPPHQDNGETISKPQANRIFALSGGNAGMNVKTLSMRSQKNTRSHEGSTGIMRSAGRLNVPKPNKKKGRAKRNPSLQQKIIAQYAETFAQKYFSAERQFYKISKLQEHRAEHQQS